jgi:hypothetical protein
MPIARSQGQDRYLGRLTDTLTRKRSEVRSSPVSGGPPVSVYGRHVHQQKSLGVQGPCRQRRAIRGDGQGAAEARGRTRLAAELVINDYRVHSPGTVGDPYRQASETAPDERLPPVGGDPDSCGRGWVEHSRTQNELAGIVAAQGWVPRSPAQGEPRFDLAWVRGQTVWVAEVKSITPGNEERQLRIAMGQVLRYRQKLTAAGHDVQAVIVTSRPPADASWDDLCRWEAITLARPEIAVARLSAGLRAR